MKLIVLTGLARSGKDTVADYLVKKYGFQKLVFSDFLKQEVEKRNLEVNKKNLALVGDELRKKNGMAAVAKMLWKKAKNFKKVVAVGARSVEEIEFLKTKIPNLILVAVKADKKLRFERRLETDPKRKKDFFARDKQDIENKGLNQVLAAANHTIENNSTLSDLKKAIDELMEKIYK